MQLRACVRSSPGLCRAGLCGWNANGETTDTISWHTQPERSLPAGWQQPRGTCLHGLSQAFQPGNQRWELQPSKEWNFGWSPKLCPLLVCCSRPWWKREVPVPNPCSALPEGSGWQVPAGILFRLLVCELETCLEIGLQMPGQWPLSCSWSTA